MFDNVVSVPYVERERERLAALQRHRAQQAQAQAQYQDHTLHQLHQPSALRAWLAGARTPASGSSSAAGSAASSKAGSPAPEGRKGGA